jgi:hypothetical protein
MPPRDTGGEGDTMKATIRSYYARERANGWRATTAIANARTRLDWETATDNVRLSVLPDDFPDLSFLDDKQCFPASVAAAERARANDEGVWGIVGQFRCPCCGNWTNADSCFGFIGEDWKNSGYDTDIMRSTLDARSSHVCG